MTSELERARTLTKNERGVRTGAIDESWHQGRGAFGGLLAAMALDAMSQDLNDAERIPRSLTVHFCGPATGAIALSTSIVRAGSRVAHATARIDNESGVTTYASASFCKDRPHTSSGAESERYVDASMPRVEDAASTPEMRLAGLPGVPQFFRHIDARFCATPPFAWPFSAAKQPNVAAWVRLREAPSPGALVDAPLAALLLDTLPPAVTATFDTPRPLASVDFTIHFFTDFARAAISAADHQLVAIRSRWAADGYTEELRELWSPRGELLAQCQQLIALL